MDREKDLRSQEIQKKIHHLQQEQTTLEQKMIHDLFFFLKSHQAFSYPFNALLGGFIEVLETLSLDTDKTENWSQKGVQFQSKKKPSKTQRNHHRLSEKSNSAQSTV